MSHMYQTVPRSQDLPTLPAGIEVIIARTRATDDERSKPYGRTPHVDDQTVLVMLGPDAQSRRAVRSHFARYMNAEIDILQVPSNVSVDAWLGDLLFADGCFMTSMVLTLPQGNAWSSNGIVDLIHRVNSKPGQCLEVAIAVSASLQGWQFTGVRAVVQCDGGREAHDALIIFDLLASFSAPEMIGAFDTHDMNAVLGDLGDSLMLVEGIWNSADETICIDPVLAQLSKGSEIMVLVLTTGFPRFKPFAQLMHQIRHMVGENGTVLSLWTEGLAERVSMSQQFIPFYVLIRSTPPASQLP